MQVSIHHKRNPATEFHIAAAEAYELAAHHHRQAAQHRERGEHREASNLSARARTHLRTGDEQARVAAEYGKD